MFQLARLWLPVLVLSLVWSYLFRGAQQNLHILGARTSGDPANVLLLTAHPDDECMFFAPTILALLDSSPAHQRPRVHSLCLSVGNADGLGYTRRQELVQSLDVLGIEEGRRWVVDRSDLQDNFTAQWEPEVISDVLKPYVLEHRIDAILTFDHNGISSHPNHISLPNGAAHLLSTLTDLPESPRPRLFSLVTVPLYEKYLGPVAPISSKLSISLSQLWSRRGPAGEASDTIGTRVPIAVSSWQGYARALKAMMQHRSQLVWFRWLYVSFSRYMWVNEWAEVVVPPAATSAL
ncbi:putative deacetylase LmbE-like domain-containing protein [Cubamyces lactineus]|nr:putative deacetylase LmbE-like domain-containing protein [Cubamyces lactineus]